MSHNTVRQDRWLNLAQQGDADSLTALMNYHLLPLGVKVLAIRQDDCLVVTAQLPSTVDRLFLINFMREGMERLQAPAIRQVLIVGQDREQMTPDWQYTVNLHQADLPPVPSTRPFRTVQPVAPLPSQPLPSWVPHPLARQPIRWLLLLATCGLLVGGTFAARVVFLVEHDPSDSPKTSTVK